MVTAVMMASCTIEQDDFFSDSSANRADAAIAADVQVLTSAANGWLMQYFPDSQQSYGGYNVIARFKTDGKVEIMGEVYGDTIYTSLYSVTQSAGIVLTFDSFNPEFHAFSDPAALLGGSEGTGWDGDFDFSILKATAEEVVLKGKKTGNKIVMTPMPTSDWEAYLSGIWDVEEGMNAKKYGIHIGGEEIIAQKSNRTLNMSYEEDGEEYEVTASYIITPQGYKFYEPITIKGQTIDGFNYVEGADVFPASNNANITLNVIYPSVAEIFVENYWFVSLSSMGEFAAPYWNAVKQQIMPSLGEQLQYFAFGAAIPSWAASFGNYWGASFNSGGYAGVLGFSYQIKSDDEIMMGYNAKGNKSNGDWYVNNAYFHYFIVPFGCTTSAAQKVRVFKITADNPKEPSILTLTDEDEPTNVITLYANYISDPLNK
jgi:hypothetical protein